VSRSYIFDLGQVLLTWDPHLLFGQCVASASEREWIFANIFNDTWRDRSDIYVTVKDNVDILAARNPAYADIIRKWDSDFFTMMPGPIKENWRIVRALQRRRRKVFALANFAADKYAEAQTRFSELRTLDGVLISAEARYRKPEPGIYRSACEKFALAASEAVFIDDSVDNVMAARAVGMTAVLYTDHRELLEFIQRNGEPGIASECGNVV
jgi:2-haloacid dehalogenase